MIPTHQGMINQEQTDTELDRIGEALELIFNSQCKKLSFQKTYQSVYRLCRQGLHQELADLTTKRIADHFKDVIGDLKLSEGRVGETLANAISNLMEVSQRVLEIFLYLEANHRQREGAMSLRIVFNNILFETLMKRKEVMEQFVFEIADLKINGDSQGAKKLINLVASIDEQQTFISQYFLPVYLPRMKEFFSRVTIGKIKACQWKLKEYLQWAVYMLDQEQKFMSSVVSRSKLEAKQEFDSVLNQVYGIIVTNQKKRIYELDPKSLFTKDTPSALELFNKVNNTDVKEHTDWYIEMVKSELGSLNRTHNHQFLQNFIRFYNKVTEYLSQTDKAFGISYKVKLVFEEWINGERINLPYRLNLFINSELTETQDGKENTSNSFHGINQSQPNKPFIASSEVLFKLLKKKDDFQKGYRKMIVKRKISSPAEEVLENRLIDIMGTECGQEWVAKIENLRTSIKEHNQTQGIKKYMGRIDVVTFDETAWPYEKENFNSVIAPELMTMAADFEKGYALADKRKKIKWHPTLGTAKIAIRFLNGHTRTFIVDTCQASMLLYLKRNGRKMRIQDFARINYFNTEQIKEPFKKLLKSTLLICDEKNFLELNENFLKTFPHSGSDCIDLTEDENADSIECVEMQQLKADRKLMVEAMVIKIMKASKVAPRQTVLKKLIPIVQSRGFMFNKQFAEESIDRLLDKEYIRDFKDGSLGYIA